MPVGTGEAPPPQRRAAARPRGARRQAGARGPELLVENGRRGRRVRWLAWGALAFAAWWLYWGADLAQTYGTAPGDGGVLRPAGERLAVGAAVALLGLLPLAGMALYVRRYVVRLERWDDRIAVTVAGLVTEASRIYPLAAVQGWSEHEGRLYTVHAPWITLRIAGRRYVVDRRSAHLRRDAVIRLGRERVGGL